MNRFVSGSCMTTNRHGCELPPLGAFVPASMTFQMSCSGTGSGFSRRIARSEPMIVKTSVSIDVLFAYASPPLLSKLVALRLPSRLSKSAPESR